MSLVTGPRILWVALVAVYGAFAAWYGGDAAPLTSDETERYLAQIRSRVVAAGEGQAHGIDTMLEELRRLCKDDDGREFWMLNLIDFREQARYPMGSPFSGSSAAEADSRYSRAIVPVLLKHAGHPVLLATPSGRFIDEADDRQWERVAVVRYRSRRDLLEIVVELAGTGIGQHKWASIERTQVFPMTPMFMAGSVRGQVAVLLAALGGLLHLLLRRRAWYARRRPGFS